MLNLFQHLKTLKQVQGDGLLIYLFIKSIPTSFSESWRQ